MERLLHEDGRDIGGIIQLRVDFKFRLIARLHLLRHHFLCILQQVPNEAGCICGLSKGCKLREEEEQVVKELYLILVKVKGTLSLQYQHEHLNIEVVCQEAANKYHRDHNL